jgi:hypothetical protein
MVKHNRAALNHLTYNNSNNMGGTVYNPHLYSTINHSGNNQSGHMRTSYWLIIWFIKLINYPFFKLVYFFPFLQ